MHVPYRTTSSTYTYRNESARGIESCGRVSVDDKVAAETVIGSGRRLEGSGRLVQLHLHNTFIKLSSHQRILNGLILQFSGQNSATAG